jgi:hypothetical protein
MRVAVIALLSATIMAVLTIAAGKPVPLAYAAVVVGMAPVAYELRRISRR